MNYSVQDLKNDVTAMLHGTTANQIQNFDGAIDRGARQLLLDLDPQETKRSVEFVAPIFNTVFDYPIAADVKGNKIIDIYPQVQRIPQDIWLQSYNQAFDVAKQNIFSLMNMFTMNFNSGLKTIRVNAPWLNPPVIINQIEAIQTNGTWFLSGDATNLTVNNTNFAQGAGSLQFDINSPSFSGSLVNTTMESVNLSELEFQSSFFVWVYVPTGSDVQSVQLNIGSSDADYWSFTVTQTQQGTTFVNGWNLCQFVWAQFDGTSGTPDSSDLTYAQVNVNLSAVATAVKVNGLNSILGTILSYEYYSKYLFRDSITGTFQETVTDDANLINLDTESYNLLTYQVAYLTFQQQQGQDAREDAGFAKSAYDAGILRYKSMYKSELQKPQSNYYQMPVTGYNNILGRGWQ